MKAKIDKTLKEVRLWKRKVADKVKNMTPDQMAAYFNAAKKTLTPSYIRRAA
jgi:hypothetical protein